MRARLIIVLILVGLSGGLAGLLLLVQSEPSTGVLDADLADVKSEIRAAEEENSKYISGLIKALIIIRLEILRSTEAMLNQKRMSFLRRIELQYTIAGKQIAQTDEQALRKIQNDLEKAGAQLTKDEGESSRYSAGLIGTMSLMAAATDRVTLAQLRLAYYSAKYGLLPPIEPNADNQNASPPPSPGTIVKDRDAF